MSPLRLIDTRIQMVMPSRNNQYNTGWYQYKPSINTTR